MSRIEIEEHLRQTTGLDSAALGKGVVEKALEARLRALGTSDAARYSKSVLRDPGETQRLIEEVVVPETWFFREPDSLARLVTYLRDFWLARHGRPVRILSLPCASGEEPYSIAMALLDAGVASSQYRVDGVDIHEPSIRSARDALYGRYSFRAVSPEKLRRHIDPEGDGFRVRKEARESVHFQQDNLFSPGFSRRFSNYDVVLCRNLLIYCDEESRQRAERVLAEILSPSGILILAAAESLPGSTRLFTRSLADLSSAYDRTGSLDAETRTSLPDLEEPPTSTSGCRPLVPDPLVVEAERLAGEGKLPQALTLCASVLDQDPLNADIIYLLGLLESVRGDEIRAEKAFRQTLYLEPDHVEALTHLALQLERQGRTPEAERLRERVNRSRSILEVRP